MGSCWREQGLHPQLQGEGLTVASCAVVGLSPAALDSRAPYEAAILRRTHSMVGTPEAGPLH